MSIFDNHAKPTQLTNACVLTWSVYESDSRVRKYAETLAEQGVLVDVLCLSPSRRHSYPHEYYLCGVHVLEIDYRIQETGISSYALPLLRFFLKSFYYTSKLAITKRYGLVHVHSIPDFEVFAALIARWLGAKIILDIHDPMPDLYEAKFGADTGLKIAGLLRWFERVSVAFADHVITVTPYWRDVIVERTGMPPSKASVIRNVPDLHLFDPTRFPRVDRSDGDFVILYPGTLNKHCGLEIAVKAVKIAKEQIPSIRFEIYGKGSEAGKIESLIDALELENTVFLRNMVGLDSVPSLMAKADVGIALLWGTDRYARRALNSKIFEFQAMGVPVIATRVESTENNLGVDTVLFSNANDAEDVARAIIEIYSDNKVRERLRNNGLKFVRNNSWEGEGAQFLNILKRMLGIPMQGSLFGRYASSAHGARLGRLSYKLFYFIKPLLPRMLQVWLRQRLCARYRCRFRHVWPIDYNSDKKPEAWSGWPQEKRFALVLTHDVEAARGQARCSDVMELEKRFGFRSSFNFVAEDYVIRQELLDRLRRNGFEIGVHGLHHDAKMYRSKKAFDWHASRINQYLKDWGSVGFRSPTMRHHLEWIDSLNIVYDASTFDTDPFEPQPDGLGTIFPLYVKNGDLARGYVELPYTLAQDFSLFVLLKERSIDIWKRKLDWIVEKEGMALMITHPDYMIEGGARLGTGVYPMAYYEKFLEYVQQEYEGMFWNALPHEIASFWLRKYIQTP